MEKSRRKVARLCGGEKGGPATADTRGECAGMCTLEETQTQRAEVEWLVDEALKDQPEGLSLTQLIEHHIRMTK